MCHGEIYNVDLEEKSFLEKKCKAEREKKIKFVNILSL